MARIIFLNLEKKTGNKSVAYPREIWISKRQQFTTAIWKIHRKKIEKQAYQLAAKG
jgi:hypothetical protein